MDPIKFIKLHILSVCVCVCVCVYSLRYPPCNEHAPYCHRWPVWLYHFMSTLSHEQHNCWKRLIKHELCISIFSATFV